MELSEELKLAAIDGFDISSDQYPPKAWRPETVNLIVHDAFKPFAEEYQGVYDVVHVRFLLTLVSSDTIQTLLQNLLKLLKPSGYLQWVEPDMMASRIVASDPQSSTAAVEELQKMMQGQVGATDWVKKLPQLFKEHGLHVEAHDKIPLSNTYRYPWAQGSLAGLQDLVDDSKINRPEAEEFIAALNEEVSQGVSLDIPRICIVGKKS